MHLFPFHLTTLYPFYIYTCGRYWIMNYSRIQEFCMNIRYCEVWILISFVFQCSVFAYRILACGILCNILDSDDLIIVSLHLRGTETISKTWERYHQSKNKNHCTCKTLIVPKECRWHAKNIHINEENNHFTQWKMPVSNISLSRRPEQKLLLRQK